MPYCKNIPPLLGSYSKAASGLALAKTEGYMVTVGLFSKNIKFVCDRSIKKYSTR